MFCNFDLTKQYFVKGIFYAHLKQNCLLYRLFHTDYNKGQVLDVVASGVSFSFTVAVAAVILAMSILRIALIADDLRRPDFEMYAAIMAFSSG